MIYVRDEDGDEWISDACADCEHSYVEDIWGDWCCRRRRCKYTKAEIEEIIKREEEGLKE